MHAGGQRSRVYSVQRLYSEVGPMNRPSLRITLNGLDEEEGGASSEDLSAPIKPDNYLNLQDLRTNKDI